MSAPAPIDANRTRRAKRAIGAMFFAVFGTAWMCWGDLMARGRVDWTLAPLVAAGLGLLAWAWRRFQANRHLGAAAVETVAERRAGRVFHAVNAGQWLLIFVLAQVLNHTGLGRWFIPMVIAVVGLHLLPLAAVMRYRAHYVSGLALLALAMAYPVLASAGPLSPLGPTGAGLILWLSAAYALSLGSSSSAPLADVTSVFGR